MKSKLFLAILLASFIPQIEPFVAEAGLAAEATEIIGVVRIGVSLVEYIYKGKSKSSRCQFALIAS